MVCDCDFGHKVQVSWVTVTVIVATSTTFTRNLSNIKKHTMKLQPQPQFKTLLAEYGIQAYQCQVAIRKEL